MANDGTVKIGTDLDDSGFKSGLSKLGSVAKGALTGVTAGVGAASAAIGALSAQALNAYASYEQLVGGVETLFKDSADTIQEYAANAYKTAGVSANSYMEQATAFSASLIQSLGGDTEAAAEYANQAIMDMSDNANKMGTDIEVIQQTYQSLMRGNYAMLDNLKLGYGGTKAELERLVSDAETLTGKALDPTKFSDVITAINAVQTELGITGTTALEASTTIEGSVNSMKAAFENLLTGIADDNADLDTLVSNFVESVSTAADNILPRISQILSGLGSLVEQLAPIIAEQLPIVIEAVFPSLVSAGAQLIVGLVSGIVSALPTLAASAPQIVQSLASALQESGPSMLESGAQLLTMLGDGIIEYIPELIARLPEIIVSILEFLTDNLPAILQKGAEFVVNLALGIIDAIPKLVEKLPEVIEAFTNFIIKNLPVIVSSGSYILASLAKGIIAAIPQLVAQLPAIISAIVNGLGSMMGSITQVGKNIVTGLWNGINSMVEWIKGKVSNFVSGIVDNVKGVLGIHSPSTVMRDQVGKNIGLGVAEGIEDSEKDAKTAAERMAKDLADAIPAVTMGVQYANAGMVPSAISPSVEYAYTSSPAGTDTSVLNELRAIRDAVLAGQVLMVDKRVLGQVAASANRTKTRMLGVETY